MFSVMTVLCIILIVLLFVLPYIRMLHNHFRKAHILIKNNINNNNNSSSSNNDNCDEKGQSQQQRTTIKAYAQAPGPLPWPILGNLGLLGRHKVPFEAFIDLSKTYGDAFALTLGSTRCLVVNNLELIREVLNQNGKFFGGRPDFMRYIKLFGGDRNNSLALCDWSNLQQKRRNLARRHCSPRDSSLYFTKMSNVGCLEASELMDQLQERMTPNEPFEVKPLIQQACANMFSQYMCSMRFNYDDAEFQKIVEYFDEIFWEINQGYAVDFMPFLSPFYKNHFDKIINWSTTIRNFILERVINDREQNIDIDEPENDFTDALLKSLVEDKNVSRDTIIYMLEDFIGGHSAVGNLVMLALTYVAKHPQIGVKIQEEIDQISNKGERNINLYDMDTMPYTVATIYEVLRYSSSPIVPHVATEDAVISGYGVTTGTIVFINNYKLNTSSQYWTNPELFDPERFLDKVPVNTKLGSTISSKRRTSECSDSGVEFEKDSNCGNSCSIADGTNVEQQFKIQVKKSIPHFLPFSIGKRTCIGQNLVRGFGFILLANILQKYIVSSRDPASIKLNAACVALPARTFPLVFNQRCPK